MNNPRQPSSAAGQFGPRVYADWRTSSLGEITEGLERKLLFRLAGEIRGRTVLDVGCGDGTLTRAFARAGAAAAGCDTDPRMIARAASLAVPAGQAVDYTVADTLRLPFADGHFDVVTVVTVLAFVPDARAAVQEMARVLKPGGRLIIGDLGKWNVWAMRRRVRGWLGSTLWRGATFRTAAQLRGLADTAGLRVEHVSGAIFFPPWPAAARRLARWDAMLGEWTTFGAAFVAVQARKE